MNWRDTRLLGVLPAWVIMVTTLMVPILLVLAVSFATRGAYGGFEWKLSGESYKQLLFQDGWSGELEFNPQYLFVIGRTLYLAALTTVICAVISFPVAYFISQREARTKAILIYLVTLPFWVSMIVRVYAWITILGNDGVIELGLKSLGIVDDIDSLLFNDGAMLVGLVYSYVPLMILPVFASVEKLDSAFIEASHDLYGNAWVTLKRVILPLTWPGILAGSILVFVPSLGAVLEPVLLGGGKNMLMGNLIQLQFGTARNWPLGSAIAILLLVMVVLFLIYDARRAARTVELRT
jgi:spermidine/putrescine transport system permease protein